MLRILSKEKRKNKKTDGGWSLPSIPPQHSLYGLGGVPKSFFDTDKPIKQTFRNRTETYGPNGKLKLTVPIVHTKSNHRQLDKSVVIHYENDWQNHWKSLESAYRSSPFFEFYEDDFYPFYHQKFEKLMNFNICLIKIISLLDAPVTPFMRYKSYQWFTI